MVSWADAILQAILSHNSSLSVLRMNIISLSWVFVLSLHSFPDKDEIYWYIRIWFERIQSSEQKITICPNWISFSSSEYPNSIASFKSSIVTKIGLPWTKVRNENRKSRENRKKMYQYNRFFKIGRLLAFLDYHSVSLFYPENRCCIKNNPSSP